MRGMSSMLHYGTPMSMELPIPELAVETSEPLPALVFAKPIEPKQKFRDAVVSKLTCAKACTEELRQQRGVLIGEALEGAVSLAAVDEFLDICDQRDEAALILAHSDIRAKGREQIAIIEKLQEDWAGINASWNYSIARKDEARARHEQAKEDRKRLSKFASDAQVSRARANVNEKGKQFTEATNEYASLMQAMNSAGARLNRAKEELQKISIAESEIRAEILGETYYDSELGLEVKGGTR
jgi:hypothetical protein